MIKRLVPPPANRRVREGGKRWKWGIYVMLAYYFDCFTALLNLCSGFVALCVVGMACIIARRLFTSGS